MPQPQQIQPQDLIDAIVAQRDAALASAATNAALLADANRQIKELQEKLTNSSPSGKRARTRSQTQE